ncbi:MAG: PIN domain-containing protein [Actinobacteria bacterium]|nr:PIN domain-containing protein [Actinomycetota bacterium]
MTKPAYLIDSDALIWYLRGRPRTVALLDELALTEGPLGCSALTLSEVLRGAKEDEVQRTEHLLNRLIVLPVGAAEAKLVASLMRQRGPGYVDCHVAATAILAELTLVTYNLKDFRRTGATLFDTSEW